jgi:phosphohistidine swiveling domain-containing protein
MLKSLVHTGVFSQGDYDSFLGSLTTVSGDLARDKEKMSKGEFLKKYGHLRPGTYDILSERYDENPGLYFQWSGKEAHAVPPQKSAFALTLPQMRRVESMLKEHRLEPDPVAFFNFLEKAIQLREWSKFQFTKNLSDILVLIGQVGKTYGFSREDMAFSEILAFKELHITADFPRERLAASIASGREKYRTACRMALPPLLTRPEEIWGFLWPETSPNFITQKSVVAEIEDSRCRKNLAGKIVCIPSADPGYDWLFSHSIGGLVTAWGGANSHMAIRAGELGLPAVIGAGEANYQKWSNAKKLKIDCANRKVEILT